MHVSSVMTKKIISVKSTDSLQSVVAKLAKHDISSVPVLDSSGRLVGLVTEGDTIKAIDAYAPKIHFDTDTSFSLVLAVLKGKTFSTIKNDVVGSGKIKVGHFMKRTPHTIGPDEDIYDAARAMNRYKVKMLPVVGKNRKVLGVIARADVIKALAK